MKIKSWIMLFILNNCYYTYVAYDSSVGPQSLARPPNYSNADSWTSEDLLPKEKSLIHVKLVRPSPKTLPEWEARDKNRYLLDLNLDFDSPIISKTLNNCLIEYKDVVNSDIDGEVQWRVEISGPQCSVLPLNSLQFVANLVHLIIKNTSVTELTKFIFGASKLDKLKRIDLISNNHLKVINDRTFDGLSQLNYLSFIDNRRISIISREAFVGLKSLEELIWISNSPLTQQTFYTLTRSSSARILPSLMHLHISGPLANQSLLSSDQSLILNNGTENIDLQPNSFSTPIKVNKDDLILLTQLKYLQLTDCDIEAIHSSAFVPLRRSLIGLNLSGNRRLESSNLREALSQGFQSNTSQSMIQILDISNIFTARTLPKVMLSVISKTTIHTLYLNYLKITEIYFGDIPPMPYLKELYIQFSELEFIEENSFATLENVVKLSLRGNYLRTIANNFIYNLPKLQYLDLSGYKTDRNHLDIPDKTFVGTNLIEVNLSYKLLDPLPRNAFLGLFKMQKFHLRGCGLKFVEYLTFFPLKSTAYIDLSENEELISSLRVTHEDSFFGLEAVEMVRMSSCNLTARDINDEENIFKRLHEMVKLLDLSHNLIDQISSKTFLNFTEIQEVDLSHNSITSWTNFSIFATNKYITTLDISNNKITHLTSTMLEDFHRLKNLSFASNPLICDCNSQVVADWLNDTSIKIQYIHNRTPLHSKTQYYCLRDGKKVSLKTLISECKELEFETQLSLTVMTGIASVLLVITLVILVFAFIYHSTIRHFIYGTEEDSYDYIYDAFVSYNVNDSEWVFKQLVPNIENTSTDMNRVKLCVYDRDFIAGRPISECILESIKTSRKVILVISNNFVRSPWCRFETDLAHNTLVDQNRDGLIMIKLEDIDSSIIAPQLYFLLKTRIYLQWNTSCLKEQEVFWKKLRRIIVFHLWLFCRPSRIRFNELIRKNKKI
ncbi:toll-like receptor 4 [Oppia nitens]|uniref:toll-like receptor 4 n=1 Tax=Oppia nitens TaxID=1686743 RepID=UPI0023DA6A3B|nr:toll-like receptor 4 [Oppia nitens]